MFVDRYSAPSDLNAEFSGSKAVGLCGLGTQSCYDLVVFAQPGSEVKEATRLFVELEEDHPDYKDDLQELSREMNKLFRERAPALLKKFRAANPKIRGHVHLAAIGSPEGLHLAYATRLPADELVRRGANLAKSKLQQFAEALLNPPSSAGKTSTKKRGPSSD